MLLFTRKSTAGWLVYTFDLVWSLNVLIGLIDSDCWLAYKWDTDSFFFTRKHERFNIMVGAEEEVKQEIKQEEAESPTRYMLPETEEYSPSILW